MSKQWVWPIVLMVLIGITSQTLAQDQHPNPLRGWEISDEFPYESKFVQALDSNMHYVEAGTGQVVLFLHGNPTSSYLWRNVMPYVAPYARAVAVDLIGMGRSDKPDIEYRFHQHAEYLEAFIDAMGFDDLILVMQDWGSGLGFDYAARHPDKIKGLVFFEAMLRPFQSDAEFRPAFRALLDQFRTPGRGEQLLIDQNYFLDLILPGQTQRDITQAEWTFYKQPYLEPKSRRPVMQWPRELVIAGQPADTHKRINSYSRWLQKTDLPKLMLHARPGALMPPEKVQWAREHMSNLTEVDLGQGVHHLQEENPHAVGAAVAVWLQLID